MGPCGWTCRAGHRARNAPTFSKYQRSSEEGLVNNTTQERVQVQTSWTLLFGPVDANAPPSFHCTGKGSRLHQFLIQHKTLCWQTKMPLACYFCIVFSPPPQAATCPRTALGPSNRARFRTAAVTCPRPAGAGGNCLLASYPARELAAHFSLHLQASLKLRTWRP